MYIRNIYLGWSECVCGIKGNILVREENGGERIYIIWCEPHQHPNHTYFLYFFLGGAAKGRNRERKYIIWSNPSKTLFNYIQLLEYAIITTYFEPIALFSVGSGSKRTTRWPLLKRGHGKLRGYMVTWLHRPKKRNLVTTGSCSYVVTQILGESFTMWSRNLVTEWFRGYLVTWLHPPTPFQIFLQF